jgi:RND family efflux transporter MFP subunit
MAVWKQILAALIVLGVAFAGWALLAPQTLPAGLQEAASRIGLTEPQESAEVGPRGGAPGRGGGRGGPGGPGGFGGGPERVVTAEVRQVSSTRRVQSVGTAEAQRSVTLFAPTAGLVDEVLFESGEQVEQDQPLMRLDDREEQIAVEMAEIRVQQASEQVERFERLLQTQAVSTVQLDEARANLASARATLRGAELDLERRTLRAPFPGYMGLAQITRGDRVTATTTVANIDDRTRIYVRFSVPERFAGRLQPGSQITATTVSFGSRQFAGTVAEIDSRIDPQTRTLTVRAAIDNDDDILRPGMAFLVEMLFDGEIHTAVPLLSLQWDRDGSYVWQVVDGRVRRANVEIIERGSETALVNGALTTEDRVVLEGVQRLRDGAEVTVAERDEDDQSRS